MVIVMLSVYLNEVRLMIKEKLKSRYGKRFLFIILLFVIAATVMTLATNIFFKYDVNYI